MGLGLLPDAAGREYDMQKQYADPPFYPQSLYNSLGEAYLDAKSPVLAAQAFEKALELTRNDIFAFSGLVRAYAALGEKAKAEDDMAGLLFVASNADAGLKILERAKATGITATLGSLSRSRSIVARTCSIWGRSARTACVNCTRLGRTRTNGIG